MTHNNSSGDPPLRYHLIDQQIGVPSLAAYIRTLVGGAVLFGLPPLLMRGLARLGLHGAFYHGQRWWAAAVRRALGVRLTMEGLEHIDPHETYVIAPLHEGFADILALLALPLPTRFVVRDELVTWRRLGPYLRDTEQIVIRPEARACSYRQLLRRAREVFAARESLVIFPQGTILGIETQFTSGAFALARALKRPLLPVALTGGHRVWEHPYTPRLRYGQPMSLRVFAPISVNDVCATTTDDLRQSVQRRLKAAALDGMMAQPRHFVPARDGYWDGYAYHIDPHFAELAADVVRHRTQVERQRADGAA